MSFYDDASLIMYPSGYKEDKIYSLKPTDGSGDLTFTRASTATRVNSDGLIDGVRTNLNTYSQNFTATGGWAPLFGATITRTANYGTAPDGTTTSTRIVFSGGSQIYSKTISGLIGNIGVFSLWIKGTAGQTITITYGGASDKLVTLVSGWNRFYTNANVASNNTIYINTFISATARDIEVWGGQVELGDIATDYIPTTTTAVSVGMLADVPRIDYTGGNCGKLLLEGQRTNLVTYSEDFSNAAWAKQDSTITSNAAISPDGTTNADLYTTTSDLYDFVRQSITYISGTSYTISVFVKQGTSSEISLFLPSQAFGSNQSVTFDVSDGTYTITSGSPSVTIEDYGNGWYRCALSATATISATRSTGFSSVASGAVTTLYLYGAQVEANASYATSYIPTLASSVTRLADAASKTGISSLIGGTSGTVFFDIKTNPVLTTDNYKQFFYYTDSSANQGYMYLNSGNGIITNPAFGNLSSSITLSPNTRYKIALTYANNDFALYVNGTSVATALSGTPWNFENLLSLGNYQGTAEFNQFVFNQYIHFPTRLTNTQLATLTTI